MKYELFDYQSDAVRVLSKHLVKAAAEYADDPDERTAVVLVAPTGAGKTVIATGVIEAALDGDDSTPGVDGATFLWVTDDPALNRQTRHKMMDASSALAPNRLIEIDTDFDEEVFEPGAVYFLNVQKLAGTNTLTRSRSDTEARTYSLWQTIANTVTTRPQGFVVVLDEAHRGSSSLSGRDSIVNRIIGGGTTGQPPVPVVWGISATPRKFLERMDATGRTIRRHTVKIEDVRASGLLKDQIVIGDVGGVDAAETGLVRLAVRRVRDYDAQWTAYSRAAGEPTVEPVLVVQVADMATSKDLFELVNTVLDEWKEITVSQIVHTFGDHSDVDAGGYPIPWCPPEDIQDRRDVRVVLCKTAITTGWDCPRAEVLLSMRVARDLDNITQVMGRMVRTPLAKRVSTDQRLNTVRCILPKFDKAAVSAIAEKFQLGVEDDGLAGGTDVIIDPVDLQWNPHLMPEPVPERAQEPKSSSEGVEGFDLASSAEATADLAARSVSKPGRAEATPEGPNRTPAASERPAASGRTAATPNETTLDDSSQIPEYEVKQAAENSVFDILTSLPSYTIPRRSNRSSVELLTSLAALFAVEHDGRAVDRQAPSKAVAELLAVIDARRYVLAESGELETMVHTAGRVRLRETTVSLAEPNGTPTETTSDLVLDARGVRILMNRAKAKLPQGLALDYVKRLAPSDDPVAARLAMLTTIALANAPGLSEAVEHRAADLLEQWLNLYGGAITRLPIPEQDRIDKIKAEVPRPVRAMVTLPKASTVSSDGPAWEQHVLSDSEGKYHVTLLTWEEHVLRTELEAGVVAWYRNPPNGRASLVVPYQMGGQYKRLAPDFIFFEHVGGQLAASIVDPHGTHLGDTVPKLKGLAAYAAAHGSRFARIQSVVAIENVYWMLNHQDPKVRDTVREFNGDDARDLFLSHGKRY